MDIDSNVAAALTGVSVEQRALVLAAALDEAIGAVEGWDETAEKESALGAMLLAACEHLATRSHAGGDTRNAQHWMTELLDRAKQAVAPGFPVLMPQGGSVVLGEHRYEVQPLGARLVAPGQLALAFEVKLANESRYDANFWSATFRLTHGDESVAPTTSLNELVAGRTTATAQLEFTVPAETRTATLLVGDDAATAVALPVVVIPVGGA